MRDRNNPLEPRGNNQERPIQEQEEITSASIKNAHAAGDGAIEKSDEVLLKQEDDDESTKRENY